MLIFHKFYEYCISLNIISSNQILEYYYFVHTTQVWDWTVGTRPCVSDSFMNLVMRYWKKRYGRVRNIDFHQLNYLLLKLHIYSKVSLPIDSFALAMLLSKVRQLCLTERNHSDHLAFFRRTLGTRLGSKYKPYWNYIQGHVINKYFRCGS